MCTWPKKNADMQRQRWYDDHQWLGVEEAWIWTSYSLGGTSDDYLGGGHESHFKGFQTWMLDVGCSWTKGCVKTSDPEGILLVLYWPIHTYLCMLGNITPQHSIGSTWPTIAVPGLSSAIKLGETAAPCLPSKMGWSSQASPQNDEDSPRLHVYPLAISQHSFNGTSHEHHHFWMIFPAINLHPSYR